MKNNTAEYACIHTFIHNRLYDFNSNFREANYIDLYVRETK